MKARRRTSHVTAAISGGVLLATLLTFAPSQAAAARRVRPLFEPTDLELETPGVLEADLQLGIARGEGPGPLRMVVPDFELDLGLLPFLELDVDGAYAVEGPASGPFAFDHAAPDSLWLADRFGVLLGVAPKLQLFD